MNLYYLSTSPEQAPIWRGGKRKQHTMVDHGSTLDEPYF